MSENTAPEPQDSEREKLRRERELLLTRFDPAGFGRQPNTVFTDPDTVSVKDDPEQTAAWIDKMQKDAAAYWRRNDPADPPASSEQRGGAAVSAYRRFLSQEDYEDRQTLLDAVSVIERRWPEQHSVLRRDLRDLVDTIGEEDQR